MIAVHGYKQSIFTIYPNCTQILSHCALSPLAHESFCLAKEEKHTEEGYQGFKAYR